MSEDLQKNIQEINKLPGLKKVKDEVRILLHIYKVQKKEKKKDLETDQL